MEPEGLLPHSQVPATWASSIQPIPPHPTSWTSILILSSHIRLGLPSGLFSSGFSTKTLYTPPHSPHTRYLSHPSHSSRFDHPNNIVWGIQIIKLLIMLFSPLPCYLVTLRPKYSLQHPILRHRQHTFLPQWKVVIILGIIGSEDLGVDGSVILKRILNWMGGRGLD